MKKYLRYLITFIIGLLFVLLIVAYKQIFSQDNIKVIFHTLTDGFFIVGILMTCFGLLVIASNGGGFDMLAFGLSQFFNLFRRDLKKAKYKTFNDYRLAKSEKKATFGHFIIVGLFFLLVCAITLTVYYRV